jgi:nitronate monooxygenase
MREPAGDRRPPFRSDFGDRPAARPGEAEGSNDFSPIWSGQNATAAAKSGADVVRALAAGLS